MLGLLLGVVLFVSGCTTQKVLVVAPLPTTATTTELRWVDVAKLPIGTVVDLTGYTSKIYKTGSYYYYELSQNQQLNPQDVQYAVFTNSSQLAVNTYVHIRVRVEAANDIVYGYLGFTSGSTAARVLREISRKVITQN